MSLLTHLGFNTEDLRTYHINFAIYKDSKDTTMTVTAGSAQKYEGFMKCLKLDCKLMCDICNNKSCFR